MIGISADWAGVIANGVLSVITLGAIFVSYKSNFTSPKLKSSAVLKRVDSYLAPINSEHQSSGWNQEGYSQTLHMFIWNTSSGVALLTKWGYQINGVEKTIDDVPRVIDGKGVIDLKIDYAIPEWAYGEGDETFEKYVAGNDDYKKIQDIESEDNKSVLIFAEFTNHKKITAKLAISKSDSVEYYTESVSDLLD